MWNWIDVCFDTSTHVLCIEYYLLSVRKDTSQRVMFINWSADMTCTLFSIFIWSTLSVTECSVCHSVNGISLWFTSLSQTHFLIWCPLDTGIIVFLALEEMFTCSIVETIKYYASINSTKVSWYERSLFIFMKSFLVLAWHKTVFVFGFQVIQKRLQSWLFQI